MDSWLFRCTYEAKVHDTEDGDDRMAYVVGVTGHEVLRISLILAGLNH